VSVYWIAQKNNDVKNFAKWLWHALKSVAKNPESEQVVSVSAWHEWAEVWHLEPYVLDSHGHLECVQEIIDKS